MKILNTYIVTILSISNEICNLSNGSKIDRKLFYNIFKPVVGVVPNEFFSSSNKVFNIKWGIRSSPVKEYSSLINEISIKS